MSQDLESMMFIQDKRLAWRKCEYGFTSLGRITGLHCEDIKQLDNYIQFERSCQTRLF